MFSLVMRDVRMVSFTNIVIPIVAIGCGYMGASLDNPLTSNIVYLFGIFVNLFFIITIITTKEAKTKANALIVSLPIKRFDVVKSRYITMLMYMSIATILVYISSHASKIIFSDVEGVTLGFTGILIMLSLNIIYLVINLPIQYYNIGKAQIFNALFYAFIILFQNVVSRFNINLLDNSLVRSIFKLGIREFSLILFALSILMYFTSLFVSKSIYSKKEF